MARKHHAPLNATPLDWAILGVIIAIGGSSFVMIRNALETMPPLSIALGRMWIGSILVYAIMRHAGRRLPPLFIRAHGRYHIRRSWLWMTAAGIIGVTIPFLIFPWAQQYVESGLAGVYMAFMPIWTIALAYFFAGETLNSRKLIGFILGFIGVLILMGPEVLQGAVGSDLWAQASLLVATFCYAASIVIARRAPPIRPRVFTAGMVIVATIAATPALFFMTFDASQWSLSSMLSVIGLGVFPTGINGLLIIILVRRAGAGFMSLSNYFTPIWAVAMGAAFYNEKLALGVFIALVVILIGVAISQSKARSQKQPAPLHRDGVAANPD